jgi:hypothetical protein
MQKITLVIRQLQNCPIRTKYLFDTLFWLADFISDVNTNGTLSLFNMQKITLVIRQLQNCPIRTKYLFDTLFWLADFFDYVVQTPAQKL